MLTKSNRDEWFQKLETIAAGEDMSFLLTESLNEYSTVKETERDTEPGQDWVMYYNPDSQKDKEHKYWRIRSLHKEYLKAESNFSINLSGKINDIDKERIKDVEGISSKIKVLKDKYFQTSFQASSKLIRDFTSFAMDIQLSPSDNWVKIFALRREAHRHSGETRFSDDFMWNTFIYGLRPEKAYVNITDGFANSPLDELSKLEKLDEKWLEVTKPARTSSSKPERSFQVSDVDNTQDYQNFMREEAAYVAYGERKGFRLQTRRSFDSTRSDSCFKCGSSRHRSIACQYAEIGFEHAKKARIRREGDESDEDKKVYQAPRPYASSHSSPHRASRDHSPRSSSHRSDNSPRHEHQEKTRSPDRSAHSTSWRSRSKDNLSPERGVRFGKEQAKLANKLDEELAEEFSGMSWDKRSEIPSENWASDTGCTTSMTDRESLFSAPVKPCRRRIQVGGGFIYSSGIGTSVVELEDGHHFFVKDTLLVPGLGCNLLSSKKLLGTENLGLFDSRRMVFARRCDGKHLIEAESRNGLYIVSKISDEANGMTFGTGDSSRPKAENSEQTPLTDSLRPSVDTSAVQVDLPHQVNDKIAYPNHNELQETHCVDNLKSAMRSKTRFPNRYAAFEAVEEEQPLPASNNIYDNLDDEGISSASEDEEEHPYAEVERGIDRGHFPQNINKRDRNAVFRRVRKVQIQQGQAQPKERSIDSFTLKEKKQQRELARYVYYHRRFCHANPQALSLLHTVCHIKKIIIPDKIPLCETCARQKIRKNQSKRLADHAQKVLALISFDIAGPFPTSYRGYRYFGEIVDSWSRKTWTLLFKDRTEVLPALQKWKKIRERETGEKLRAARTDNAPEILETLKEWEESDGVAVQTTEPHTSAQNGTAERSIQYTENNVRAMLDDAELPVEFWCEAAKAQAYVRARMRKGPIVVEDVVDETTGKPFKVEYQISPEEAYTRKVPKVHDHIKTWGCKVIAHVARASLPGRQDKLMPTGREGIFMGYDDQTTAHHMIYAPDMHTTIPSSNVRFFEDIPGSSIDNYQLWVELSDGSFEKSDGNYSRPPIRNRRGRQKGWRKDGSHLNSPTVDSIRDELADNLPDASLGSQETTTESTSMNVPDPEYTMLFQSPAFKEQEQEEESSKVGGAQPNTQKATVEDEAEEPLAPLITPEQEQALARSTPMVVIGTKRPAEEEPDHAKDKMPRRDHDRQYSEDDRPEKRYFGKKADDPRNWKLPGTNSEDQRMTNTPDFSVGNTVVWRDRLRSGDKRLHDGISASEASESNDAKRLKSMMALIAWFDNEKEIEGEEAAMVAQAATHDIPIPRTYNEAVNDPDYGARWREAIEHEIGQLLANNTWREDVYPEDANLISTKWVFTLKFNPDGTLERFKARIVARGFTQQYGIDYTETFAPTVRMATLRAFMAVVACEDLECRQYDIKNAFTESKLREELWMKFPQGVKNTKPGTALRLLRSLYGLKQSARDWNLLMKEELLKMGFNQSRADPCLFVHVEREIRLLVYVDDLAAAAPDATQLDWFYDKLSTRFKTKNLGEISKILGVRVTRDRIKRTVELDQEQYLDKTLTKFGFPKAVSREVNIPMAGYDNLRPAATNDKRIDATWYRERIGSLMYAMVYTRPDIAFALGRLSQFMQDPAEHHAQALKHLMRYLRSTISLRISFGPIGKLVVYSDADWASDKTDRKSITASVGMIGGGPVFWASKKQTAVATATTEAEYVAMSYTAKQGQWVAQILRDLGFGGYVAKNHQTVDTRGDNQGAIALAKNPHLTERSKHIDISYHYVRDLQEKNRVDLKYVPTNEMVADGLSKPLPTTLFNSFMKQIGMVLGGSSTKES